MTGQGFNATNWVGNVDFIHDVTNCLAVGAYPESRYGWTDEQCSASLPYICEQSKCGAMMTSSSDCCV